MRHDTDIERWMKAEEARDDSRAETAFLVAMARLPRFAPLPGFADRVMAAVPAPARRAFPWLTAWHVAVAAALALIGATATLVPALPRLPVGMPRLATLVKAWAVGAHTIGEWLQSGVAVWLVLLRIGRWVSVGIQSPEIAAGLAGSAVLGALGLYTLNHLLALERSSWR